MIALLNSPAFALLATTLLHFLWQGVLVALFLKTALSIIPVNKAQLRYLIATLAMLACLVLPLATFQLLNYGYALNSQNPIFQLPYSTVLQQATVKPHPVWLSVSAILLPTISVIWLTVVSFLLCRLIVELHRVNQLTTAFIQQPSAQLQQRFFALSQQINLPKVPQLLISSVTQVPMAIGWLKPVVLIPCSMLTGLTPAQIDMLILHELAHIKRYDYLVNILQTLVETLLFFHPAVYWVSKQVRDERECCADDLAVRHCGDNIAYARALTDTANHCHQHNHAISTMALASAGGNLTSRVLRLVKQPDPSMRPSTAKWLPLACILTTGLTIVVAAYLTSPVEHEADKHKIALTSKNQEITKPSPNVASKVQDIAKTTNLANKAQKTVAPSELTTAPLASTKKAPPKVIKEASTKLAVTSAELKTNTGVLTAPKASSNSKNNLVTAQQNLTKLEPLVSSAAEPKTLLTSTSTALLTAQAIKESTKTPVPLTITNKPALITTKAQQHKPLKPVLFATNKVAKPLQPLVIATRPTEFLQAKLVKSIEPEYPIRAQRLGMELDIKIEFTVGKDGLVKDLQFESEKKLHYFKKSIRTALKKWRFEPALVGGEPVESTIAKIFSFNLVT